MTDGTVILPTLISDLCAPMVYRHSPYVLLLLYASTGLKPVKMKTSCPGSLQRRWKPSLFPAVGLFGCCSTVRAGLSKQPHKVLPLS